jgi:hypothetical protein
MSALSNRNRARAIAEADLVWFEKNPGRRYRIRPAASCEVLPLAPPE